MPRSSIAIGAIGGRVPDQKHPQWFQSLRRIRQAPWSDNYNRAEPLWLRTFDSRNTGYRSQESKRKMSDYETQDANDQLAALWRAHAEQALARLEAVRARRRQRRSAGNVVPFPTRRLRIEE